jgi:hypothetical protein
MKNITIEFNGRTITLPYTKIDNDESISFSIDLNEYLTEFLPNPYMIYVAQDGAYKSSYEHSLEAEKISSLIRLAIHEKENL